MSTTSAVIRRAEFDLATDNEKPRTLPGRAYCDESFFAAEVEHLFRKNWFPVAHEQMLPNVGDYFTIDLWGQRLVVVRGDDQVVRALERWCPLSQRDLFLNSFVQGHCEETLGTLFGHRCPIYDLRGRVVNDNAEECHGEGSDTLDSGLTSFALESWEGFLFVNLSGDASSYAPDLASLTSDLANYDLKNLSLIRTPVVFEMEANWKLIAENYIEAYHHLATHRNTFEKVSPARTTFTDALQGKVISLRMPIKIDLESAFELELPSISTLTAKDLETFSAHMALPCFLITPAMNSVAWLHLIPVSAQRSYWMIYMLAPPEYLEREEDVKALFSSSISIHNEDMDACIGNQKGYRSRFFKQGYIHPELEKGVSYLDNFVLDALARGKPGLVSD